MFFVAWIFCLFLSFILSQKLANINDGIYKFGNASYIAFIGGMFLSLFVLGKIYIYMLNKYSKLEIKGS